MSTPQLRRPPRHSKAGVSIQRPNGANCSSRLPRILNDRKEQFAREMTEEMGKVISEARGDVQEAIDMTFYMAGEGRRLYGQTTPSELPNKFNMSVRKPIGVAGIITPWNFPMAIPSWKMTPALVAGNTIVFKPASFTPRMAVRFVEVLQDAGIPDGVVNLVIGGGEDVGNAIVEHPDVALISFTGSTETGVQLAARAAALNKRVSLEMGGKNAVIVLDDANLELAVDGILWSAFGTSGQRCTAASRVIVQRSAQKELVERLVARTGGMRLGNGLDESIQIGPVVSKNQLESINNYVQIGQAGGRSSRGWWRHCLRRRAQQGLLTTSRPSSTTSKPSMRIANEEIFGPVTSIVPVDTLDEAIDVANGVEYGLSASIFTQDINNAYRAMRDVFTGILYVNAGTTGAEIHLPFGGTKATGNGHREAGTATLDFYTEWQSIYVDFSGKLQRAQIDNQ